MLLYDYQDQAIRELARVLMRNPILVAPTGGGKTVMGVTFASRLHARVLWVAHRRELIQQAARSLKRAGARPGIVMAGYAPDPAALFQVASVDTLRHRSVPPCDAVVIDECHHASATSYAPLFELGVPCVGLTATPFRLDGRSLGDRYGAIVVAAYADELVDRGFLVPARVFSRSQPDLSGVGKARGDYKIGELAKAAMDAHLIGDIVDEWFKRASGLRTVCFAINVEHSREIVRQFQEAGVPAEHLDGNTRTADRDAILARLASGETLIVSNCQVLTEGWDLPELGCGIMARPTESLALHLQMIGRVVRSCEGKAEAIILDHAGNHHRHGPFTRRLRYSLEKEVKVEPGEPLGLIQCKVCYLMYDPREGGCPGCGSEPAPGEREIKVAEGELVEMDSRDAFRQKAEVWAELWGRMNEPAARKAFHARFEQWPIHDGPELLDPSDKGMANKERVYRHLLGLAISKGYRQGWASVRYKELFGVWPTGFVSRVKTELTQRLEAIA